MADRFHKRESGTTLKKSLFQNLLKGVRETQAIRAGKLKPVRVTKLTREHPRVVRTQLGMTQERFADVLGVPVGTLRNWEQGIRQPVGAAKTLLRVAAKNPQAVLDALAAD